MPELKENLIELVKNLEPDKVQALYSYANYLKQMPEDTLILEEDDKKDLEKIIQKDKYYSEEELLEELPKK